MANVHDVASYLTERLRPLGTMKLEKLAYYCQGWHLARFGSPLFDEPLEAWKMGPVSPDLYAYHRRENFVTDWPVGSSQRLSELEKRHIDSVIEVYGVYSGFHLGRMTHLESPWTGAITRGWNEEITHAEMKAYFEEVDRRH